jgi:predicted adenylyl cyclase CyaB
MEVEIKIKIDDPQAIKDKILSLGGKKIDEGLKHDVYYDDGKGFYESGRTIRLRTGNKNLLTYKEPSDNPDSPVQERLELQIAVEDPKMMEMIMGKLGFKPYRIKEKKFEEFEFDGFVVELHTLPFLGDYLEIEAPKGKLEEVLPKLGLSVAMGVSKGYGLEFKEYRKEHGLSDDVQDTFEHAEKYQKEKPPVS